MAIMILLRLQRLDATDLPICNRVKVCPNGASSDATQAQKAGRRKRGTYLFWPCLQVKRKDGLPFCRLTSGKQILSHC